MTPWPPPPHSSGSDDDHQQKLLMDQKKQRRMQSNRESARRSRMRKQKYVDDLLHEVTKLKGSNGEILSRVNLAGEQCVKLEAENEVLRTEVKELGQKLVSLNSVLLSVEKKTGLAMDIPAIPDPLLKPWQLPCPPQLIVSSAKMLQC